MGVPQVTRGFKIPRHIYIYNMSHILSWSFTTWMMFMGPIFGQQSRAPSTAPNLGREAASGSDPHGTQGGYRGRLGVGEILGILWVFWTYHDRQR